MNMTVITVNYCIIWRKMRNMKKIEYEQRIKNCIAASISMFTVAIVSLIGSIVLIANDCFEDEAVFIIILLLSAVVLFYLSSLMYKAYKELKNMAPKEYHQRAKNNTLFEKLGKKEEKKGTAVIAVIGIIIFLVLVSVIVNWDSDPTVTYYQDSNGNGRFDKGEFGYYKDSNGTHFLD